MKLSNVQNNQRSNMITPNSPKLKQKQTFTRQAQMQLQGD